MGNGGSWSQLGLATVRVVISPAQIQTLAENPITIIGPPGAGFANVILAAFASLEFGTTLYQNLDLMAGCALAYLGGTQPAGSGAPLSDDFSFLLCTPQVPNGEAPLVTGDAVQVLTVGPLAIPTGLCARSQIENCVIVLTNNGSVDFSVGDSSVTLTVLYFVMHL